MTTFLQRKYQNFRIELVTVDLNLNTFSVSTQPDGIVENTSLLLYDLMIHRITMRK